MPPAKGIFIIMHYFTEKEMIVCIIHRGALRFKVPDVDLNLPLARAPPGALTYSSDP